MNDKQRNRKSRQWYIKQAFLNQNPMTNRHVRHCLAPGMKGFFVTCNNNEKLAVRESYNILNEYAEKIYGAECTTNEEENFDDDIEKAVAKHVENLNNTSVNGDRRFQNVKTGAKNCLFIKTVLDDPAAITERIFTDLAINMVQKSRHALRMLPVIGTCKANEKDILSLSKLATESFFTEAKFEVTFCINIKVRNCTGVAREQIECSMKQMIFDTFENVLLRYSSVNPDINIFVEIMCGIACIAVVNDFLKFRKYNLVEVSNYEKQCN